MVKGLKQRVLDALSSTQGSIRGNSSSASSSGGSSKKNEPEIPENLTSESFQLCKIVRHGFPHRPTAIAYDPMQKLLAIGNFAGSVRFLGQAGVDIHVCHDTETPVIQLLFLINEGGLISVCADHSVNLWNLRQNKPGILHSLSFNREKITHCHLPYQSKWLYIGTDRGNVHMCSVENFVLSGYVINWNKAIQLSQKSHPGYITGLCENPCDENRLLIAYETGLLVLWDLKSKFVERRFSSDSGIRSLSWDHEGKQFMCCHSNGSLSVWNYRTVKPQEVYFPHSRSRDTSKFDNFWPINKSEWKSCRNGDPFVIFSGGLSKEFENAQPSITITHGRSTRVLEMDHNIVDFLVISATPWQCDFQDPIGLVVLLEKDLVTIDLVSNGLPTFDFPHPMDIHSSPVTCLSYITDTGSDLITGLYQISSLKPKKTVSNVKWPLDGGVYSVENCVGSPELMITGHADGVVKFWDASNASLRELYQLRTQKFFKKPKKESGLDLYITDSDQFAISHIHVCPESRGLLISNASGAIIFCELNRNEITTEITSIELLPIHELFQNDSPDHRTPVNELKPLLRHGSESLFSNNTVDSKVLSKRLSDDTKLTQKTQRQNSIFPPVLKLRHGSIKQSPGFQSELICQLSGCDADPAPTVTAISYCSDYGVLAIGTLNGIHLIDSVQKKVFLSVPVTDIAGDKKRGPKSPNRVKPTSLGDIVQMQMQMHLTDQIMLKSPTALDVNESFTFPANKSPHKDSPPTVNSAGNVAPPRPKYPPKRVASKKTSSSFERSLDSQTSVATDDTAFSRAQSICDLDNQESKDMVTCVIFADTFARKEDTNICASLLVGTASGALYAIEITQPEQRFETQLVAIPTMTAIHMKGAIVNCALLDSMGQVCPPVAKKWKEIKRLEQQNSSEGTVSAEQSPDNRQSRQNSLNIDKQFLIVTSETQIKVFTLPTHSLMHVYNSPNEGEYILKSEIAVVQGSSCILSHASSGRIMIHSLPSLSPLMDVSYLPYADVRISQTLCFTNGAQMIFMPTASEVQRVTCSSDDYESIQEIMGHLFTPQEAPERPNPGFFKSLFGGGVSELDREELFGEARSGKASKAIAKHIPGTGAASLEGLRGSAQHTMSEMDRLRMAALERGEKLSELEEKTQRMQESAQKFQNNAHSLMMKYKNKKWYQL